MIAIRRVVLPGDPAEGFVFDTWVRSYLDAARGGRDQLPAIEPMHAVIRNMEPRAADRAIRSLFSSTARGATIWLACDEDLYLGWCASSPGRLEYVYVKKNVRRHGLANQLIAHATTEHRAPMRTVGLMTWPWVERWLARNHVRYQPTRGTHVQAEADSAAAAG